MNQSRWETEQTIGKRRLSDFRSGQDCSGSTFIRGWLKVVSESGASYGPFDLKIVYPSNFPERGSIPSVYLESHRVRWKNVPDSHIESNWKLCLFVAATSEIDFESDCSLDRLLDAASIFLVKETLYQEDLEGAAGTKLRVSWIGPEYEHGPDGLRQAVQEMGKKLGRNDPCVCGSGKKAKHCHYDEIRRQRENS